MFVKTLWHQMRNDYFTRGMVVICAIAVGLPFALYGNFVFRWFGLLIALSGFSAAAVASVQGSRFNGNNNDSE
jgi:hypothetical protein